ncbi:MAG: HIT family protein [Desulfocurvibacter africanus]
MRDEQCIFCRIAAGEVPCAKIHESERLLAFLDIAPSMKGHTLLVPKEHYRTLLDLPSDLGEEILAALKVVGRAVMEGTGADGLNFGVNTNAAAGQVVMHAHFHLIPRFAGDGLKLWGQTSYAGKEEMNDYAQRIASAVRS